jgi:hypothetical protein
MILPYSRVKIDNQIVWAEIIDLTDNDKIKINNCTNFERVELQKTDLETLNLPYEITEKQHVDKIPYLHSGKYKVTYNQTDYFMTYLDELDLFRRVVCQSCYSVSL